MMVAGLELTRITLRPSAFRTRNAWAPESSSSAAWPMTIGPEPMTRTDWISVRLGTLALHQGYEAVEQVGGVVGTGGRFGVVLDAEGRLVEELEALHHVVVEADVGDLGAAV